MVRGIAGGATELYHNNVKFETTTGGVSDETHIEGATPHLTLKRTDNANVPTIRFKGSADSIGASISFDGTTNGTANELILKHMIIQHLQNALELQPVEQQFLVI